MMLLEPYLKLQLMSIFSMRIDPKHITSLKTRLAF